MTRALTYLGIALAVPPSVLMTGRMIYHIRAGNYLLSCLYGIGIALWAYDSISYLERIV